MQNPSGSMRTARFVKAVLFLASNSFACEIEEAVSGALPEMMEKTSQPPPVSTGVFLSYIEDGVPVDHEALDEGDLFLLQKRGRKAEESTSQILQDLFTLNHSIGPPVAGSSHASPLTQSFYVLTAVPLTLTTIALGYLALPQRSEASRKSHPGFNQFMFSYLSAWGLCVGADWLQGPYVYALYKAYGFSDHEIAQLFVVGFVSALVCSCFVGSLADRFGRKRFCIAYCVLYIVSCIAKHFKSFWILMLGRITGGCGTSLLFSCFECWMVSEHTCRHGFSSDLLTFMFGWKFTISYIVAIASGLVAQLSVNLFHFQHVADGSVLHAGGILMPFDVATGILVFALRRITTWDENYGESGADEAGDPKESTVKAKDVPTMRMAAGHIMKNTSSLCLMIAVSTFEGAMYSFVFNWTRALETQHEKPKHGIVFSLMMMASMCGASASTLASSSMMPARRLTMLGCLGALAFLTAAATAGTQVHICLLSFLIIEFCVGAYYPSVGLLKSEVVPESVRGATYNLYRVPLNAIVVGLILTDLSPERCFRCCAILLGVMISVSFGVTHSFVSEER
eukprot:TRINITY_DN19563_c0_g2_i1.p1 TRINITY_DN19563_c0_g2~~TRINITY_DN19563_c0_g2_i1.p1  ORF type:complete len:567 (+),score=70.61 TRINITY_DN19563_c0_g2_i1:69-1769(+)